MHLLRKNRETIYSGNSEIVKKYVVRKLNDTDIDKIYEVMQGNPQSEAFWIKNGFVRTGVEDKQETYTVVVMEKWI